MKSSIMFFLVALCTSMVAAKPLDKRAMATVTDWFTVTETVTGFAPAETPTVAAVEAVPSAQPTVDDSNDRQTWRAWSSDNTGGNWHGGSWSSDSAWSTAVPTAATNAPAPSSEAPAASSDAPTVAAPSPTTTSEAGPAPSSESWSSSSPDTPSLSQAPATSSPAASAPTTLSSDYKQGILDSHNMHRANGSVPNLVWDDNMASIAAQIAASCVYAHDTKTGGGGYGQNIGAGADDSAIPAMITNEMYNDEIGFYPGYGVEPDMTNFESWGHYSQIVWKSTVGVGCATQYCPGGLANVGPNVSPYFTVCNYSPPGNWAGEYAANVPQPGNMPTVTL